MNSGVKRVLWICDYFPRPHDMTLGVWALESIYAIQKKGVEVVVLSPTPRIPKILALTKKLRSWHKVPFFKNINFVNVFYPKCFHYPHRIITKYLYNHLPYFETSFLIRQLEPAIKLILKEYPFQAVHTNFVFPGGYIGYRIKRKYKIPFVVHERSVNRLLNATSHRIRKKLLVKIVNEADALITPNRKMADIIENVLQNSKKVKVIRDPGNSSLTGNPSFSFYVKPERYKNNIVVLSVGSLLERKGHEYLIRSINLLKDEFPTIRCLIIGSGIRKEFLQKIISKLQLSRNVELIGQQQHLEVLKIMSWCDIFALPSWNEAGGTVYGEAMTFGKPIIACKDEGISEVISNNVNGLLVNKKDEHSLAEALRKLITDEKFAADIGNAGKNHVSDKFNYEFVAHEYIEIYSKILKSEDLITNSILVA